jgi:hypothetical protein
VDLCSGRMLWAITQAAEPISHSMENAGPWSRARLGSLRNYRFGPSSTLFSYLFSETASGWWQEGWFGSAESIS